MADEVRGERFEGREPYRERPAEPKAKRAPHKRPATAPEPASPRPRDEPRAKKKSKTKPGGRDEKGYYVAPPPFPG